MNYPSKLVNVNRKVWTGKTYQRYLGGVKLSPIIIRNRGFIPDRNIDVLSYPMVISESIIQNKMFSCHRAIAE